MHYKVYLKKASRADASSILIEILTVCVFSSQKSKCFFMKLV